MLVAHANADLSRRPGAARSEKARLAILQATAELIAINGYEHLTIEGIAARAKVGKPTIYRWWASKSELINHTDAMIPTTQKPTRTRNRPRATLRHPSTISGHTR